MLTRFAARAADEARTALPVLRRQLSNDLIKARGRLTLECGVCLDDYPVDNNFIFSACDHSTCRDCAQLYLQNALRSRAAWPVVCPVAQCGCEVAQIDWELAGCFSRGDVDALEAWSLSAALAGAGAGGARAGAGEGSSDKDVWRPCIGVDCANGVLWEEGSAHARFNCPACSTDNCLSCRTAWHPGETCEEAKAAKARRKVGLEGGDDGGLDALLASGEVRLCPHCGVPTFRYRGCDHVKCKQCKGSWLWRGTSSAIRRKGGRGSTRFQTQPRNMLERAHMAVFLAASLYLLVYQVYPRSLWRYPSTDTDAGGFDANVKGSNTWVAWFGTLRVWWCLDTRTVIFFGQAVHLIVQANVRGLELRPPFFTTHGNLVFFGNLIELLLLILIDGLSSVLEQWLPTSIYGGWPSWPFRLLFIEGPLLISFICFGVAIVEAVGTLQGMRAGLGRAPRKTAKTAQEGASEANVATGPGV